MKITEIKKSVSQWWLARPTITTKVSLRFRGDGFDHDPTREQFTHNWHLPCCQLTMICPHISPIQNTYVNLTGQNKNQ